MKLILADGTPYLNAPTPPFRVPSNGKFIQLKHDYQCAEMGYKPRAAATRTEVPETVQMNPFETNDFVTMPKNVQEWILSVLRIAAPEMSREDAIIRWHALTKNSVCFTDRWSWDYGVVMNDPTKNYADYLFGMNLQNPPMRWKMLSCGGNICKVISGNVVEAIDYTKPLPDAKELYREKPWLFQWATQCYMEQIGVEIIDGVMRNRYKISRFPQFSPANVLFPLFGAGGTNRIKDSWRMKPITNGTWYSPIY